MKYKLKKRPFCGHGAKRHTLKWAHVPKLVRVSCPKCEVGTWIREDYGDAVAVWSRRVEGKETRDE